MMIGPFRAERPAGADGDRGRQRLQHGDPRLHPALADEDRLERLRDAVSADALRTVSGHHPDDERAGDRHQDGDRAELIVCGVRERRADAVEEEEIREEPDEPEQRQRDECAQHSNARR
jgi:hypothetical protein